VTTTDLPERFDLTSEIPADGRLEALRAVAPDAFREDKIDFDALKRSLGAWVDPGPERFGLTWPGKAECTRVVQEPSIGTLVPMPDESVDWESTQNVIIEGDNLEVLKLLQKAYYGKVKLIYIDPPYNTGEQFIYPDNFREGLADYLRFSGQTDENGLKLAANAETDGRFHSKWLSMMYPRLYLARNLLRDDGVIFVSIDDHEVHNLRAIMNEIFGEETFIATCVWQKRYSRENRGAIGDAHEYLLVYGRDRNQFQQTRGLIQPTDKQTAIYRNPNDDPKGRWRPVPLDVQAGHATPAQFYSVTTPSGAVHKPSPGRAWSVTEDRLQALIAEGRVYFGKDGSAKPNLIRYLSEMEGLVPWTWWPSDEVGHTDEARKEIQAVLGSQAAFDTPKPTRLLKRVVEIGAPDGGIVMDFFAGSGTLGQAVLELSRQDRKERPFILTQLPEPTSDAQAQGTIADVCRQRIRWAIDRHGEQGQLGEAGDEGFRSYHLSSSNFAVWDASTGAEHLADQLELSVEHVAEGATELSILVELLVKAGYPLTSGVEALDVAGIPGYSVAGGALIVCLSRALTIDAFEAMVEHEPAMILVLDAGFGGSDELKVNALQTVRARNQSSGSDITLRVV
jgi:adenine-specific DNA-methyltransferase